MRIVLIGTIPNGYALREFKGIQFCLNFKGPKICEILTDENLPDFVKSDDDFYIVADYYYNPTFKPEAVSDEFHAFIRSLPADSTAIYYSDPLFKFEDPSKFPNWDYFVFFGLSNYRRTQTSEYENCRIWENVDIHSKNILDIPIPELAFWSYILFNDGTHDFRLADRNCDISYIINSKVKSRMRLLEFTDGLFCQFGNLPAIDNKDIKDFVTRNSGNKWETQKAFGVNYLYLQNGKFTITMDDDIPVKVAWPMRFYEAMCVGIVPILHSEKEVNFIYKDFPKLSKLVFKNKEELDNCISFYNSNPSEYFDLLLEANEFMAKYVYDYKRLRRKTIDAIQWRV